MIRRWLKSSKAKSPHSLSASPSGSLSIGDGEGVAKPRVRLGAISSLLAGVLVFTLACGAAATATPVPKAPAPPEAPKAPVAAPAAPAAPKAPVAAPAAPQAPKAPVAAPTPTKAPVAAPKPTPAPTAAPAVHPGKVTIMVGSFGNERFQPAFGVAAGKDYSLQIHASLISSDRKKQLIPGVASQWKVASDLLTWTFTIRKGVKFHNGTEVTPEDVVWSLLNIIGPQAPEYAISPSTQIWAPRINRIEQTGADQVTVATKAPNADFAGTVSDVVGGITGAVLPRRATLHTLADVEAYERNPIGAGTFKLVKHVPADLMRMERFEDHYYQPKNGLPQDRRPRFTTLDLRLVPEEATMVAALRAGEADIAPVSLGARKQIEAGGGRLVFGPEGVYFHILFLGCFRPQYPCSDQRVRQALNYAIDKVVMRDKLYGGTDVMQTKGWLWVTPSSIGYGPELDPYPFDPVKARQLLADAGYPGGKGFGRLLIHTYTTPNLPLMPESAQLAAEFWRRELGLDVEVKIGSEGALKKAYFNSEELYGTVFWRENETKVDGAGSLRFRYANPKGPARAHEDPELVALTNKTLAIFDPVEREKAFNSIHRRTRDAAYEISLGYINIPWGVGRRIQAWEPYPLAQYPSGLYTIVLK